MEKIGRNFGGIAFSGYFRYRFDLGRGVEPHTKFDTEIIGVVADSFYSRNGSWITAKWGRSLAASIC